MPAPADLHERLAPRRELRELLLGEVDVADREPPVERRERRGRQETARELATARRGQVDLQAARRVQPRGRQQDRDAALLEPRHRLAQERAHVVVLELHLRRLGGVEPDAELREQRLDLGELEDQIAARIARAQEREDVVAALPQEQCGKPERRIVFRLQPQLEHERRRAVVVRPLVEAQAERPRRRDDVSQAVVHPAGKPPVERRVPRGGRQQRVGRGEPVDEELERGRAAEPRRDVEADAFVDEPVARDLVDDDRVEVVDGGVPVAVERAGADRRQRGRDLRERRLHALVERGAPEREPELAALVEVGVDEPLGHREPRELDDREHRTRAPAQLDAAGGALASAISSPTSIVRTATSGPTSGRSTTAGSPS